MLHRTSTRSLSGSAYEERIENGRRYANDSYLLPSDDAEETRLTIMHQAYLLLLSGQISASRLYEDVHRILDVGTGPGDWAIAAGEKIPNAEIIATDICPYQPMDAPPNVFFQIDDAREEWTYTSSFDFIHIRGLAGAFLDWRRVYHQAFQHLGRNGVLEIADWGPIRLETGHANSYLSIFNRACQSAAERLGLSLSLEHLQRAKIESVGFSVMKSMAIDIPLGTWSRDPTKKPVGKMALIVMLEGLEATSLRLLTKVLNWTAEDVKELCEKVKDEILRPGAKASVTCQFVVARKLLIT